MQPGELRHRVTIQRLVEQQGERGAPGDNYVDWFSCWAEVQHLTPEEAWQAQQITPGVNMKVRIRYRPGLTSTIRVKWRRATGSPTVYDYLDVAGSPVEVAGRRDEIWLMCTKREADGFRTGEPS